MNSDGTIYKLLDYNLIEETGKLDAPGRPSTYGVTSEFLRIFGFGNLNELPDLPRYKIDENQQIVIDEIIEDKNAEENEQANTENVAQELQEKPEIQETSEEQAKQEAPMPEREEKNEKE